MRRCWGLACLACLVFLLISPSQADQFDDARAYFDSGDTKKGIELLNSIAEAGDAATQYRVGTELIGFGDSGMRWIESAAERGHAEAQADMGLLYASGTFVKQDLPRAFMWYFLALKGNLDPSDREGAQKTAKNVYAAMTSQQRKEAERLILNWKPR